MDNETPKYAEWIPEAGGYVSNGKVLSKSPVYDEQGKLKLNIDTTKYGNTQPQNSATPHIAAEVEQPIANPLTQNVAGSGEDVNAPITEAGSLGSLQTNTTTTGSALSTPATKSLVANYTVQDVLDNANQRYVDAVARNDYKGMIDALTEISKIDGVDRTETINNLWKARGDKIRTNDDNYLALRQRLKQAIAATNADTTLTDEEKAAKIADLQAQDDQLASEQQAYRDMVGYGDQMTRDMQQKQIELKLDFDSAYSTSINDITGALVQALPGILNFQYDPYSDANLQRAQEYTRAVMTEQYANTGMYYSSAVQYAITNAVANLVPVYEKMAKEEAIQNFNLLQQTATYLMNLEKHQFDLWESQIELKWKEADQKQKQIDNAINNANARGYYTNEEAMLVGVEAGTESYEARAQAEKVQRDIAAEQRQLEQDQIMGRFNKDMNIEYLKEQYNQMREYYDYQRLHPQTTGGGGGGSSSGSKVTIKTEGANGEEITLTMDYDEAVRKGYIKDTSPKKYVDPETGEEYELSSEDYTSKYINDGVIDLKGAMSYITNDLKDLPKNEQSNALSQMKVNIIDKIIRNNADLYGDDRAKTNNAIHDSFNAIQDFARATLNSGLDKGEAERILFGASVDGEQIPGLLHDSMNNILNSVEAAGRFDNVWGDWAAIHGDDAKQIQDSKNNAKKDLYNWMSNSDVQQIKTKLAPDYAFLQNAGNSAKTTPKNVGSIIVNAAIETLKPEVLMPSSRRFQKIKK